MTRFVYCRLVFSVFWLAFQASCRDSDGFESQHYEVMDNYANPKEISRPLLELDFPTYDHSLTMAQQAALDSTEWDYSKSRPENLVQLYGFSYCKHLDGAYFDFNVPLRAEPITHILKTVKPYAHLFENVHQERLKWDNTLFEPYEHPTDRGKGQTKPSKVTDGFRLESKRVVHVIETIAFALYEYLGSSSSENSIRERLAQFPDKSEDARHRFACFMAADGNNDWNSLVFGPEKFLRFIDGPTYFNEMIQFDELNPHRVGLDAKLTQLSLTGYPGQHKQFCQSRASTDYNLAKDMRMWMLKQHPGIRKRMVRDLEKKTFGSRAVKKALALDNLKTPNNGHRLAYFILAHNQLPSLRGLVNQLFDEDVIILIHIDKKQPEFKIQVEDFVSEKILEDPTLEGRLKVMKKSILCEWGGASLVYAQLEGFFELLKMGSHWEYVINLSGVDYPLRTNDAIYADLQENFRGKDMIEFWDSEQVFMRQEGRPVFSKSNLQRPSPFGEAGSTNRLLEIMSEESAKPFNDAKMDNKIRFKLRQVRSLIGTQSAGQLSVPYSQWHQKKHHQWMILSRDFIQYMRTSPLSSYMAAYSEFVFIPDESYFSMIALNAYTIHKAAKKFIADPHFVEKIRKNEISLDRNQAERMDRDRKRKRKEMNGKEKKKGSISFFKRPVALLSGSSLRFKKWLAFLKRKFFRLFGSTRYEPDPIVTAPSLKESLATYAFMNPDVCPDRKRFLHFGLNPHPRLLDETDERKLIVAVGKHRMAFARKLINQDGTAPVAKEIDRIRKMDWFYTFSYI